MEKETNDSTCANSLLCEVAVVTPRFRDYLEFIRNQKIENEKYHFVDSIKSAAKHYNISVKTINNIINGKSKKTRNGKSFCSL